MNQILILIIVALILVIGLLLIFYTNSNVKKRIKWLKTVIKELEEEINQHNNTNIKYQTALLKEKRSPKIISYFIDSKGETIKIAKGKIVDDRVLFTCRRNIDGQWKDIKVTPVFRK